MNKSAFVLTLLSCLLIQSCATSNASERQSPSYAVDPEELFSYPGFHQVMVSTGSKTIYIAGQVALEKDMTLVGIGDYQAQTIKAFQNIAIAAKAAGAGPRNIVSSTLYIKGLNPEVAQEIMKAMAMAIDGKPFPAHAFNLVGVDALSDPRVLVEISAVAVVE